MLDDTKCVICGISAELVQLEKCPICYGHFCPDCAYRATGRRLCSERCAQIFLHGVEDDSENELEPAD